MVPMLKVVNGVELHYTHPDGSTSLAATMHVRDESCRQGAEYLARWIAEATGDVPTPDYPVPPLHGPDGQDGASERIPQIPIFVNGKEQRIGSVSRRINYADFVYFVTGFPGVIYNIGSQPTIIFSQGALTGSFTPGDEIELVDGMRFEVCDTSHA
jgi:hypothetical protein